MTRLFNVLLLTGLWAALFATLDLRALAFGALVSWGLLVFTGRLVDEPDSDSPRVFVLPLGFTLLVFAFLRELAASAFTVAREAWRPTLALRPGIVAVPLDLASDIEVTVLANLISLTPGTLSIEVSPDKKTLFVHALITDERGDDVRESIRERLERPVRRAFRVGG